jgi:hypothetical protein
MGAARILSGRSARMTTYDICSGLTDFAVWLKKTLEVERGK